MKTGIFKFSGRMKIVFDEKSDLEGWLFTIINDYLTNAGEEILELKIEEVKDERPIQ